MTPAEQIAAAAALLARDPAQAERMVLAVLRQAPGQPAALLIAASARRRQGDPVRARAMLEPLARSFPRAAHTHYELGLARAACGDDAGAIAALRHALSVKPDMPDAWQALGAALFRTGDMAGMDAAFARQLKWSLADAQLRAAADALAANQLAEAGRILRDHLAIRPDDADAWKMLGDVLLKEDRFAEAEDAFARALARAPDFDGARFGLATALFRQQKAGPAIAALDRLLAKAPRDAAYRNLLAGALGLAGDAAASEKLYAELVAELPRQPHLRLNHGHALKTIGRTADAMAAYRQAIALAPQLGEAYWSLANLKTARFTDAEIDAMRAALGAVPEAARRDFHIALGQALEDRKAYAESFTHYAAAAALRRATLDYSADATTAWRHKAEHLLTADFFAARADAGCPAPDPIFIVGLPRAGSTLVEQILASHSQVEGTMELPDLGRVATRLAAAHGRSDYLDCLAQTGAGEWAAAGAAYLESTRARRRLGRRFFIDKMPNNFRHAGLIRLILPNAKIIDVRRAPLATCFSAFKQHFAQGQAFSYDLVELGRYYRDYVALMAHYDRVLPGRVHRVIYEELVADTEAAVRGLLAHCGLAFEPGCLRFFENPRPVETASAGQVRRPIYTGSLEQWRHYAPWLGPLKDALGPALDGWR